MSKVRHSRKFSLSLFTPCYSLQSEIEFVILDIEGVLLKLEVLVLVMEFHSWLECSLTFQI